MVAFIAAAAVALAAGVWMLVARSAARAAVALRVCLVAGACAYVQVMASTLAVLQIVVLAGAAVAALQGLRDTRGEAMSWPGRALFAGLLGGLVLVLVGTLARQYVWTGRELAAGSRFGTAAELGAAWAGAYAPALVAGLLVIAVAAIAGTQRAAHRL